MKQTLARLSQCYAAALRTHLKPGTRTGLRPAQALGRQAVSLGLETLGLARMHEESLGHLLLPASSARTRVTMTRRAAFFFSEANAPIEETHRVSRQGQVHLNRLKETLDQRTEELAASHRQLQRGVLRRKSMELAAVKSGKDHSKSLEESLELQTRLRQLTHRMMAAQENERTKISHELQDEIAQTLLGINVRLLSLKNEARTNTKGFHDEITSTQRLVLASAKFVRRFARKLKAPQPA